MRLDLYQSEWYTYVMVCRHLIMEHSIFERESIYALFRLTNISHGCPYVMTSTGSTNNNITHLQKYKNQSVTKHKNESCCLFFSHVLFYSTNS